MESRSVNEFKKNSNHLFVHYLKRPFGFIFISN